MFVEIVHGLPSVNWPTIQKMFAPCSLLGVPQAASPGAALHPSNGFAKKFSISFLYRHIRYSVVISAAVLSYPS